MEKSYTSNFTVHLKALEQKEEIVPSSKWQEIIKLRVENKWLETKRSIQRMNKSKIWFLDKIINIDKPLAKLTKVYKDSIKTNKIRNEKGDLTTETEEIKKKSSHHTTKDFTQQNLDILYLPRN